MEQKSKEMLIIDPPNELRFCGPFTRPVITIMKLTNPTNQTILFKIKTTAPKRYCVRPNFGTVARQSFSKVEICLQPFLYDATEKNKHKFMVQSLVAPDGPIDDLNKLWKEADSDQLMDAKLKCVFEMPAVSSNADTSGSAPTTELVKGSSIKTLGEEKNPDQTEELLRELRDMREQCSNLGRENINLMEQLQRFQMAATNKPPKDEPYYAPAMVEKQIPVFYIAISIAAAIFGLLLGKYLL